MGASTRAVAPFLDARWVDAAARLPRHDKLGSRFHRRLVAECDPRLLEYPLAGEERVLPAPRLLYWLRKPGAVGYDTFGAATRLPEFEELIRDSPLLDQFATRKQRVRVLATHDEASLDLLLTLHFAAEAAAAASPA